MLGGLHPPGSVPMIIILSLELLNSIVMTLDGGGVIAIGNNDTDSEQKASRHPFSFP
jgi:hypothetical protein